MTKTELNTMVKQSYTHEFKEQVLGIYKSGAYKTIASCAQAYNIKESTLYQWIHRAKNSNEDATNQTEMIKLRKELARAKMELEILKKGRHILCQTSEVKYMFIEENIAWINVNIACSILQLTRSAYYSWFKNRLIANNLQTKLEWLTKQIVTVFKQSKRRYGSRRISSILDKTGIKVNYRTISKILRCNNMSPIGTRKFKAITNSKHNYPVFANLLMQNFEVSAPSKVWVGDISSIQAEEGWVYIATVIDLYSRRIIGHKTDSRMTKELVIGGLKSALKLRN